MKTLLQFLFHYCIVTVPLFHFGQKIKTNHPIIKQLKFYSQITPIVIENDTLFYIYTDNENPFFMKRVIQSQYIINKLGKNFNTNPNEIYTKTNNLTTDIMYRDKLILSLTNKDANCYQITRNSLATLDRTIIVKELKILQKKYKSEDLIKNITLALLVLIIQFIVFFCTNLIYKKLQKHVKSIGEKRLTPIFIKNYEFLSIKKQVKIIFFSLRIVKIFIIIIQLLISIPSIFKIFPQTKKIVTLSFYYFLNPIKKIGMDIIHYIPNAFTIIVIWIIFHYIIKGLRTISDEIEKERLKLPGFYADWAKPTFNIIRFLLYAFMTALIYPHFPHSESEAFKGISVLVGLIFSIGSSSAISNLVAGIIITYMRPFKIGDMIKINDIMGNVIEKTPIATRILTIKNEIITFPNTTIINAQTANLTESAKTNGLILYFDVTFGYNTPWRTIHKILLDGAESTPNILKTPHPFILETNFNDFYTTYQVNAYINDADKMIQIFSELRQNIQDKFNEAGISMLAPHYYKQDTNIKGDQIDLY